jgi:glycosyltransferase involved in cell wall biosynthesis
MHICFISHEYPKPGYPHGGIGSFVRTMATELATHQVHVSVVGLNYTNDYEESNENGVHIYRLPRISRRFSWWRNKNILGQKIRQIHSGNPIDVVETPELGLAFIEKIKGIKYIIRLHGGHHFFSEAEHRAIDPWRGFQEKRSFGRADAFVAVSEYVKSHTNKYLDFHGKPVALIPSPIDDRLFRPIAGKTIPGRIVFAGTVCEKKGIRQLIRAFPKVHAQFPEATLEIYGRDWFFPDKRSYIEMLRETELPKIGDSAKAIHFNGTVAHTDIPVKYAEAEICAFPSHMETQGLVAPEAMIMGKTVLFTKLGPGPEAIRDFETGLLCDPYNPDDIAQKIIWAFSNRDKVYDLQQKAMAFASEKYSLAQITRHNIAFYHSL